ncbi:DUF2612 domain-containing protein [Achromobacter marplatensis]|uniref:DUF2612 domain-containing protein n=1 Tax=Achromobacter marplatensis TaxID=470868 RepID=UPI003C758FC5
MTTNIVNVFEPAQFGVGDGVTTQFQIGGPREAVTSITPSGVRRQDWQGNQRLYPTPRTNLFAWSAEFTQSYWGKGRASISPSTVLGPDGRPAFKLTEDSTANNTHQIDRAITPSGDTTYTLTWTVKAAERRYVRVTVGNFVYLANPNDVNVDLLTGQVLATDASRAVVTMLADGWVRISTTVTTVPTPGGGIVPRLLLATDLSGANITYTGDGVSGVYVAMSQFESSAFPTSYIPTAAAPVTVTDYAASTTGLITMGQAPDIGASLTWTGSYTYEYRDDEPTLADRTVISQYANSPTLRQLIRNMDDYINPDTDFDAFYDNVWNVETAQGFALDVWGRIVGVGRMLTIPASETFLGYQEAYTAPTAATGAQPFGQAPMYVGAASSQTYRLADDAYRKLILVKALANISDCTSPSLNRLLSNLFAGRGRCYVTDTGLMEFRYVFEFALEPYEVAIMTQSGAIPKPAAVLANVLQVDVPTTFGFNEAVMQPFGSGVFFTSSGLIHAS